MASDLKTHPDTDNPTLNGLECNEAAKSDQRRSTEDDARG
jgi:hypothetical protein